MDLPSKLSIYGREKDPDMDGETITTPLPTPRWSSDIILPNSAPLASSPVSWPGDRQNGISVELTPHRNDLLIILCGLAWLGVEPRSASKSPNLKVGWWGKFFLADQNQHVSKSTRVKLQCNRHSKSALKSVVKMEKLAPSEKLFEKGGA